MSASSEIPRRIDVQRYVPAEHAIRAAVQTVEAMPADPRLTDAVCLLAKAKDRVADFVDGVEPAPAPGLGQIAYDGYCASSGGKSLVSGAVLPSWADLKPEIRAAWESAAVAVASRAGGA